MDLMEKIQNYMENNAKAFELEGVEFAEEDYEFVENKMKTGMTMQDACDECLQGIRDCLDEGLDDIEEDYEN